MWIENNIYREDLDNISRNNNIRWDKLHNASILITGATGLIGKTVVDCLLYASDKFQLNSKVIALVRNIDRAKLIYADELQNHEIIFVEGSCESIKDITDRIDYIIHGASPTSSSFFVNYPVETIETSVIGTNHILKIGRNKNVKSVVYLSSMEVYGEIRDERLIQENELGRLDLFNIRNCYPEAKRMCENMCLSYFKEYKLPVNCLRLAQTFGPGIKYNDNRVFAMMARCAKEKKDIHLHTKGESKHSYLYTAQAVSAILIALFNGHHGEIYNVANPATYCSIYEMGKLVASDICNGEISVVINQAGDIKQYPATSFLNLDIDKITMLGWHPEHDLRWMFDRLLLTI